MAIDWAKLDAGLDALSADKTEEPKKSEGRAFAFPETAPKAEPETAGIELPYQDVEDVGTAFDEPEPLLPRENESIRAKVSNAIDEFSFGDMFDALGNARDKNVLADALEENAEAAGAYIEGEENAPEAAAYEAAEQEAEEARAAALVSPFRQAARSFIEENADDPESRWQEAAQGLRRSSANLAYFMTPEEKLAKAREVSEFTGIPANRILESDDAYRSALSVYDYAKKKQAIADAEGDDFTIEDIYSEFPGLDKIVKNDPQGAALALADIHNLREIRDGVTGAKKGWARGAKTLEANLLSWKDMKGEATEEDKKKLAELQKELAEDEFILPSVFVDPVTAIIGASSESLPLMLYSFAEAGKEGVRDAAIYATAAMAVGAATGAAPGAVAGAVGGGATGFAKGLGTAFFRALMQGGGQRALKWGARAGMYEANARAMMGEDFAKYTAMTDENGNPAMTRDQARGTAFITGGVKAGIETLSDLVSFKLSLRPFAKNAFKDLIGAAKESIKSTGSKAASAFGEWAEDAAKEQIGEMTEEAGESLTDDLATNYIADTYHVGEKLSGQEIALNALQRFIEAAPASFGLTMGGSVLGAPGRAWNYRASRAQAARWNRLTEKQRETLAGTLMLDRLQGEVEASKLKDAAPDVQQQLIREELKDTPWQMAYVDTGLVLAQEGGREDVEALGEAAGLSKEEIAQTIAEEGTLTIPTEIYAQTKTSPAALSATTFSEDAEPMAKMKERAAQYAEEIQRETHAAVNKQIELIEGVADMLFPDEKELRDEALAAIYEDPENPKEGWKSLYQRLTAARDEILAPAMEALNEGMGQGTSVVETVDENDDVQTGRASNNAEWYRRFYAEHGRKPKAREMIDLARDLTFALPGAPEVEGWRATSAEDEEAMRQGYEEYQKIEKEIEQLEAIKERMGTLTKGELDVIQGMSREGYEVYRNLQSEILQIGGEPAKAAKMNALLIARHAEVAAAAMRRRGYENYTAMDYYRDNLSVVGEDTEAPKRGVMEQFAGENAETADKMKLAEAERMEAEGKAPDEIYKATGWFKGLDGKWRFEIPDNLDRIDLSELENGREDAFGYSLGRIYDNPALYEAYPWLAEIPVVKASDMSMTTQAAVTNKYGTLAIELNANRMDDARIKNSLVHEIQHLIQMHEGFAAGGSSETVREQILAEIRRLARSENMTSDEATQYASLMYRFEQLSTLSGHEEEWAESLVEISKYEKTLPKEKREIIKREYRRKKELSKAYDSKESDDSLYYRLGGEQEARKAAARANGHTRYAKAKKRLTDAEFAFQKLRESLSEAERAQVEEYLAARDEARKASQEEARHEGMEDEEQYTQARKAAWDKESDLEAALPENVLEALQEISNAEWSLSFGKEALEELPKPHESDALIVFGGKEMPYSENRDERLAGNRATNAEDIRQKQLREWAQRTNMISIDEAGNIKVKLGKTPKEHETQEERVKRRKKELSDIDTSLVQRGDRSACVNALSLRSRAIIDERIQNGEDRETIAKEYLVKFNKILANYSEGMSEEKVIGLLINLRGAEYYARGSNNPIGRDGRDAGTVANGNTNGGGMDGGARATEGNGGARQENSVKANESRSDNQGGFSDGQIFEQAAWHGSPHIFRSFDLGAIGTGEGAQAHGWGLYFAQDRKIAEGYKERLEGKLPPRIVTPSATYENVYGDLTNLTTGEKIQGESLWDIALIQFVRAGGDIQKAIEVVEKTLAMQDLTDQQRDIAEKIREIYHTEGSEWLYDKRNAPGSLFQVEIPDNDVLLDEQKTLDEQPEKVKQAIREYYRSRPDNYISDDTDFDLGGSSGRDFYKDVVFQMRKEGSKTPERDASELLNQYGVKGITYEGGQDGRCFVVFDDKAISVIETYNQAVNGGKVTRGRIWRDRRQGKKIIQLLSTADRSTFLHEMGHLFLMDLEDLAGMGDEESQRMLDEVDDWAKWQGKGDAKKYAGTAWAKEFAGREAAILEADRAGDLLGRDALMARWRQERFARAWEIYLMEGTAPSKGLRAVFRKFKSWLRKIYNVFLSDGARASKDVEKVMARLIASEEEIERMEADARYTDFAAAGGEKLLKEDAKETFARWQEEAREEAKTRIRREIMKDLKGKRAEDWEKEMAGARARIEEELRNEPIHLARRAIEESGDPAMWKIFFDTKEAYAEADKAPSLEDEVAARMDEYEREADKARLDAEITDEDVEAALSSAHWHERLVELETQAFAKKLALTQTFGEKQQNALERLAAAISEMEETDTLEGEETEQERFKAAQKAVTSLKVSGRWGKELFGIIQRMEKAQTKADFAEGLKAFREAKKEQEKLSKKDFDTANEGEVEDARRRAKEALAKMKLPEATQLAAFRQHEREAAKRAEQMVKAKRWDVAMMCKRQQLYASMCAAEGRKIAERAQKLRDRVKKQIESKVQLPKDEGYWLAHLAYVLRIVDNDVEKPEGLQSLAAIGKQMTDGLDVLGDEDGHNELTALLLKYTDTESKEGWRGMTIGELEDAVEALNMLYTIGKDKFKMKTMQGKHIEDVRAEILSDDTSYNAARVSSPRITGNDNTGGLFWNDWIEKIPMVGGKLAKAMQWYGVSLTKPEEMIRLLGEKAHRYLYGTYDRAMAEECKETARVMKKLDEILGKYSRAERQTWQDRKYTFMGEKLSKENILAMALHLGTDSNRQRLAQGMFSMDTISDMRKQAREDIGKDADWMDVAFPVIMGFLEENMTEKDWAFVQGVWDIFKEQWPKTVETEMKLNGRRLKPLELRPFTANAKDEEGNTKEIQLRGGYCPVRYDPEKSAKAGEQAENDLAKQQMSGAMVFGMNRYFTKERTENVFDRPLLLSLSVIPSHLMASIHNSTYRLAARDVYRLLNDGEIRRRIESTMGMDAYRVLKKWATDNWALAPGTDNIAERGITSRLAYIRRNAGIAIMGFRLWPAVENATNIFPMMDRLGVAGTMTALSDFYGNMREGRELMKKSVFMMQRAEHMDRDFRQQRDMFEAKGATAEWLTGHAYSLMELTDLAGSAPLWVHTYKNAFGEKYKEVEEENKKNIRKLEEARKARDKIAADYHDKRMAAQAIEAELENRKYLRMPEPGNPLGGIKTSQLREELSMLKREIQGMRIELGKANGELDRAQSVTFFTNDEIVSEAERRSVASADEAVRDVFGSGDVKDLAEIQKGGELSKMMTAFYSYFNAQANAVLRSYWKGKWKERNLTPLGRTILFRFVLTAMLGTAGKMLLTGEGNDDKDKYRKRADGTKEEIPPIERALKAYGKNLLSTAVGGMYGVRDVAAAAINLMFDGTDYGRGISMGGVGTRIFEQTWQEVKLIRAKAERDEKERIAEEKRQAKYDKMTRKQKAAFDERQKYRKPPATISYADILRGAGSIGTSLTAARTGITEPIANAVLGTMQYLTDSDGRYEATLKNMIWSALWTKKPVKRTPPEKPEKTETPRERRRRERKERREARRGT